MTDLSANLYYMARFEISALDAEEDLLWTLILGVRAWMCGKWKRRGESVAGNMELWSKWKKGCAFQSEKGAVTFVSAFYGEPEGGTDWACKIIERTEKSPYAPREWVTEIGFRQREQTAEISFVIFYRDRPGFIGLCAPLPDPDAGVPNLIRRLMENERLRCTAGGVPVSLTPALVTEETYPAFREAVLDARREVPLLYISSRHVSGAEAQTLLDPSVTAMMLGPDAIVYYGTSPNIARMMDDDPEKEILGCYGGGVRVYAPRPDKSVEREALRHRYLSREFIQKHGAAEVYALLRRALAQDSSLYERVFRLENCRELIKRAQLEHDLERRRQKLEEELFQGAVEKEERLEAEFIKMDEERLERMIKEDALKEELSEAKASLRREQRRADSFQQSASMCGDLEQALNAVRNMPEYPGTPEKIADFFTAHFRERLDFTENGRASLKTCQTAPEILWTALYDMATTLYDLYKDDRPMNIEEAFKRQSAFSIALGAGTMTRNDRRLIRNYEDIYQGRTLSMESHLRSNANKESDKRFLRVYYCFDHETGKIVIGSCGKHKDSYGTRMIH